MMSSFIFDMQILESIKDCFVTGSWADGEDAATLLATDGISVCFLLLSNICGMGRKTSLRLNLTKLLLAVVIVRSDCCCSGTESVTLLICSCRN